MSAKPVYTRKLMANRDTDAVVLFNYCFGEIRRQKPVLQQTNDGDLVNNFVFGYLPQWHSS